MDYDNTNRGALFRNNKKTKDSQPDYTGKGNYGGKDFQISAWLKDGKQGKFMSIAFSEPYQTDAKPANAAKRDDPFDDFADAPF